MATFSFLSPFFSIPHVAQRWRKWEGKENNDLGASDKKYLVIFIYQLRCRVHVIRYVITWFFCHPSQADFAVSHSNEFIAKRTLHLQSGFFKLVILFFFVQGVNDLMPVDCYNNIFSSAMLCDDLWPDANTTVWSVVFKLCIKYKFMKLQWRPNQVWNERLIGPVANWFIFGYITLQKLFNVKASIHDLRLKFSFVESVSLNQSLCTPFQLSFPLFLLFEYSARKSNLIIVLIAQKRSFNRFKLKASKS